MKPFGCILLLFLFVCLISLSSCENDIKVVNDFNVKDTLPVESAKNVEMIDSESGKIQFKLTSPQLNRYKTEDPYDEFPKGLTIIAYDSLMRVKTSLRANYAITWNSRKLMEARNDVVIISKDEIINTEHIVWDQRRRVIFSDVFVKRTNKDGVMYGDGFDADETFNKYSIRNPRGTFSVQQ